MNHQGTTPGGMLKRERVREVLLDLIETRRPGDAIPSERTLCAELGVSRPTLRAAVDDLVTSGLLVREHGRGMFVAPAKVTQELISPSRPLSAPQAPGGWSSRVVEFSTVRAGARTGRKLRVSPAAEIVYVARLRLVDGEPIALEHLHIPAALTPGLTPEQMESGFYAHLREVRHIRPAHAVQSIEPTVVTEAEARLLGVPELSPRCSSTGSPRTPRAAPSSMCALSTAATATASCPGSPWARPPNIPRPPPRAPPRGGARWSDVTPPL